MRSYLSNWQLSVPANLLSDSVDLLIFEINPLTATGSLSSISIAWICATHTFCLSFPLSHYLTICFSNASSSTLYTAVSWSVGHSFELALEAVEFVLPFTLWETFEKSEIFWNVEIYTSVAFLRRSKNIMHKYLEILQLQQLLPNVLHRQGCNWSAHVATDWQHTSIRISRTLIITCAPIHESTLSRIHILESGLLEMQIHGQKLSKPFGANIFRGAWERAFKGGWDPLWNGKRFHENNSMLGSVCEESNYVSPITGWQPGWAGDSK